MISERTDAPRSPTLLASPWRVMVVVLLIASAFVTARLAAHDWDPSAFIVAGDLVTDPAEAPNLVVKEDSLGYDGQYFHRLARNPVTREAREFGTELDRPAYRHARIGYPATVWIISGGRATVVPWALIAVNLVSVAILGGLAAQVALDARRPAWWGLVAAGWPGLLVALAYDLSEVLAATLLVAAVLALRRQRWLLATLALTGAGLTRETTLVLAAGIVVAVLVRRWWRWREPLGPGPVPPMAVGLVPLGAALAIRLALRAWWSDVATAGPEPSSFIGVPVVPLLRQLWGWATEGGVVGTYQLIQVVALLAVVLALAASLRETSAGHPHERAALVAGLVIIAMLPVWDRSVVYLRWVNEVVLLGLVIALQTKAGPARLVAPAIGALALSTALVWVAI